MKTKTPGYIPYTPIDEQLERPKVRILRMLRHFHYVGALELYSALEINYDRNVRDRYHQALRRLVEAGMVVDHPDIDDSPRYRITDAGQRELKRINHRGRVFFPPQLRLA